jgi:D-glycero-D-manno-heptose 1,7-bisphosphate phosphatase
MTARAAFLDRDGTLNVRPNPHEYVRSTDEFRWLPGASEGAARLASAGFTLIVVSNQRGIARGLVTELVLHEIEQVIQSDLADRGCRVACFRYCPHDLAEGCECRKPKPGLLLAAAAELGLDLHRSWMIGDSETDVQAGHAAGCRAALVAERDGRSAAEITAPSLGLISRLIVSEDRVNAA